MKALREILAYRRVLLPLLSTLIALLLVCSGGALGLDITALRDKVDDYFYDLRLRSLHLGRPRPAPQIVLAGMSDDHFASHKDHPVQVGDQLVDGSLHIRPVHAQVIKNLKAHGVRVIFYDVLFDEERGPQADGPLVEALHDADCVVLAGRMGADRNQNPEPPALMEPLQPLLDEHRVAMGLINISEVEERRWATLGWLVRGGDVPEHPYPSGPLATLSVYQGLTTEDIRYTPTHVVVSPKVFPVSCLTARAGESATLTTWTMPLVYHARSTGPDPQTGGFPVISYDSLLDPQSPDLERCRDAVVFVGDNTSQQTDLLQTPVGPMKGFEIHAQIFNTLLTGPYWVRPQPGSWLDRLNWAVAVLGVLALAWVTTSWPTLRGGLRWAVLGGWLGVVLALGVTLTGYILNLSGFLFMSLIAVPLCLIGRFLFAAQFLERFIPKAVVDQLLATGRAQEGTVVATVIVTDIRGYTTLSESKTPLQILTMLNEYHTETVSIYHRYGGNVLNYQGDAQIVLFGLPGQKLKDPAGQAVRAALETSKVVEQLRDRWGIKEKANFDVGAGVCTGPVAVGELGASSENTEYTVIGETVRKCHKVQSMSNALDSNVLLDKETYEALRSRLPVERVDDVQLEGIAYTVTLYRTLRH